MKVIVTIPQAGKTTEAIEIARQTKAYLVVRDRTEAKRIYSKNPDIKFPITFEELLSDKVRGLKSRNIVIDNLDMFIQRVLPLCKVEAVTLTKDERAETHEPSNKTIDKEEKVTRLPKSVWE